MSATAVADITGGANAAPSHPRIRGTGVPRPAMPDDRTLAAERRYLLRFALQRTRDRDLAEDAVQETWLAALKALPGFDGRSSLRTWLVSILRNKIADLMRGLDRSARFSDELAVAADEDDEAFDEHGRWNEAAAPHRWADPQGATEDAQFRACFEACLKELPPRLAEVFALRELHGESIEDISRKLGITENNCSVMLFRARSKLRERLTQTWFASARPGAAGAAPRSGRPNPDRIPTVS